MYTDVQSEDEHDSFYRGKSSSAVRLQRAVPRATRRRSCTMTCIEAVHRVFWRAPPAVPSPQIRRDSEPNRVRGRSALGLEPTRTTGLEPQFRSEARSCQDKCAEQKVLFYFATDDVGTTSKTLYAGPSYDSHMSGPPTMEVGRRGTVHGHRRISSVAALGPPKFIQIPPEPTEYGNLGPGHGLRFIESFESPPTPVRAARSHTDARTERLRDDESTG